MATVLAQSKKITMFKSYGDLANVSVILGDSTATLDTVSIATVKVDIPEGITLQRSDTIEVSLPPGFRLANNSVTVNDNLLTIVVKVDANNLEVFVINTIDGLLINQYYIKQKKSLYNE